MKKNSLLIVVALSIVTSRTASAQSIVEATHAFEVEKYSQAEAISKALIKQNTSNADAYYCWGQVLMAEDKTDSAKIIFNKGIIANNQSGINYIGLSGALLDQDNITEAQKNIDNGLKIAGPKDVNALIAAAEACINNNSKLTSKALQYLNQAATLESKNPVVYLTMGDAYLADNNGGQAVTNYEKATELDKTYAKAYLRIGVLYFRARNAELAEKNLKKAIEIDPSYAPAYSQLAELQSQKRQYKEATESFKKYLSLVDNTVSIKIKYAKFLYLSKDYPKTIEVINEVFKVDSSNIIMKRLLSWSLYEQKQYVEGLKYMNKFFASVEKKKILADDYMYYGRLLFQNNQDSLAILNLKKALEMDNTKTELFSDIAESYYRSKNYHEAAIWFGNKFTAHKGTTRDQFRMAQAFYYDKNYKSADSIFAKITETQPAYYPGYQWRGRCNSILDSQDNPTFAAKPFFDKVIELASADETKNKRDLIEAYQYMRFYYIKKEDNANAKQTNRKILELDPENQEAKEIAKQLK